MAHAESDSTDAAILEATYDLLVERGFDSFSTRDIAERAGVDPATLGADRGSRSALVVRAVEHHIGEPAPCPDTGSFRDDLVVILTTIIERVQAERGMFTRGIEALSHRELATDDLGRLRLRLEVHRPAFERAVARGELDPDYDLQHCFELLLAQPSMRWLEGRPVDPSSVPQIVDLSLGGLAPGHDESTR